MLFYLLLHKLRFISFIINEHDDDDDDMFFLVRRITSNIWLRWVRLITGCLVRSEDLHRLQISSRRLRGTKWRL